MIVKCLQTVIAKTTSPWTTSTVGTLLFTTHHAQSATRLSADIQPRDALNFPSTGGRSSVFDQNDGEEAGIDAGDRNAGEWCGFDPFLANSWAESSESSDESRPPSTVSNVAFEKRSAGTSAVAASSIAF